LSPSTATYRGIGRKVLKTPLGLKTLRVRVRVRIFLNQIRVRIRAGVRGRVTKGRVTRSYSFTAPNHIYSQAIFVP
jgi:hypothetical protein